MDITGGESSERNAGGDSSDQGTLGCPPTVLK